MDNKTLRKLFRNLSEEYKRQKELLSLLTQERASIVRLQQDELDAVVLEKEALLGKIKQNRDEREGIVVALSEQTDVARKDFKLEPFVESIEEKRVQEEFKELLGELSATAETVHKLNSDNASILKQSLGLVSSSLAIMRSRPQSSHSSYSKSGKMEGDEETLSQNGVPISSFNKSA